MARTVIGRPMSASEVEFGREMSAGEAAVAPDWQSWAIDCLDDEQLSHCGHLDSKVLNPGCTYCRDSRSRCRTQPFEARPHMRILRRLA